MGLPPVECEFEIMPVLGSEITRDNGFATDNSTVPRGPALDFRRGMPG
jgi:hypothetical protein